MHPKIFVWLITATALAATAAASATADYRSLSVDVSKTAGALKPLRGVNGVPDMSYAQSADKADLRGDRARPTDVSAGYRAANINLVRTHDSLGAGDIDPNAGPLPALHGPGMGGSASANSLILFPDAAADPTDPKSYNFGPTDHMIGAIEALGAQVIFRLGRGGGTTSAPPTDLAKYGQIIQHIVMHYNRGWAHGYHYGIKYWEVWNEPDLDHIFWRGTPDQYYGVYDAAAMAVKRADPNALIGGPTIALVNETTPFREGFLAHVRARHEPLDFYSWHYYSVDSNDPQDFSRIGRQMRTLLDRYGFTHTQSVLDEWNYGLGEAHLVTPAHRAAFITSSILYMQDAPIDVEAIYRADSSFGADGASPDKVGQALVALGHMSQSPARLFVRGADTDGLAAEAGKSGDGELVQILISNYQIPDADLGPRTGPDTMHVPGLFDLALLPRRKVTYANNRGYALTIRGLRPGRPYVVERYRVSDSQDFGLLDSTDGTGPLIHLSGDLPPPGIDLLVVRPATASSH